MVPPSPFLSCDPGITLGGSGVLSDPALIDEQFRNAWLPYFCREDRGVADPSGFDAEVGGWLPTLSEVEFPPLVGRDLFDAVHKKKPTAGSLDGWVGVTSRAFLLPDLTAEMSFCRELSWMALGLRGF